MMRKTVWAVGVGAIALIGATVSAPGAEPSATQIIDKSVAARGGREAWRKIQTMVWLGHIESARLSVPRAPFVLEMKRPDKTRFEVKTQDQLAVHVYDGTHGWKLRLAPGGRPELQPYTAAELSFAHDAPGIDGPLMDYQAKGVVVALDGVDNIEGRRAYRLSVKLPSGMSHHVWIDAESFLEVKYDRESRNAFGQSSTVVVRLRNYQTIQGLQIPLTIESGAGTSKETDKMVIDKVLLNPPLTDRTFAKPAVPPSRNTAFVRATSSPALRRPTGAARSASGNASPPPHSVMRAGEGN